MLLVCSIVCQFAFFSLLEIIIIGRLYLVDLLLEINIVNYYIVIDIWISLLVIDISLCINVISQTIVCVLTFRSIRG